MRDEVAQRGSLLLAQQSPTAKASSLVHGPLNQTFLVPTSIYVHAAHLRDGFMASLPAVTGELAQDDGPSSVGELVARFLGYIAELLERRIMTKA
jgi:fatty acid synthase subunit beta